MFVRIERMIEFNKKELDKKEKIIENLKEKIVQLEEENVVKDDGIERFELNIKDLNQDKEFL